MKNRVRRLAIPTLVVLLNVPQGLLDARAESVGHPLDAALASGSASVGVDSAQLTDGCSDGRSACRARLLSDPLGGRLACQRQRSSPSRSRGALAASSTTLTTSKGIARSALSATGLRPTSWDILQHSVRLLI